MKPISLAVLAALALVASSHASAECSIIQEHTVYRPGDKGFFDALNLHNNLSQKGVSTGFRSASDPPWELTASQTAFVSVSSRRNSCSVATDKFNCTYVGCNESIPGTGGYAAGDTITTNSCNPQTFVYTTTTWTKQPNGTWTVTTRNSEQRTHCDPD